MPLLHVLEFCGKAKREAFRDASHFAMSGKFSEGKIYSKKSTQDLPL